MARTEASAPAVVDARFGPLSVWPRTLGINRRDGSAGKEALTQGPDARFLGKRARSWSSSARRRLSRSPNSRRRTRRRRPIALLGQTSPSSRSSWRQSDHQGSSCAVSVGTFAPERPGRPCICSRAFLNPAVPGLHSAIGGSIPLGHGRIRRALCVAASVRLQQSGRCRRGCCSCACYSGVHGLTVEGGRQTASTAAALRVSGSDAALFSSAAAEIGRFPRRVLNGRLYGDAAQLRTRCVRRTDRAEGGSASVARLAKRYARRGRVQIRGSGGRGRLIWPPVRTLDLAPPPSGREATFDALSSVEGSPRKGCDREWSCSSRSAGDREFAGVSMHAPNHQLSQQVDR